MSNFWTGFEKRALHDRRSHEDMAVAGSAFLPLGPLGHTSLREGRDGKRLGDYAARALGALVGSIAGAAVAGAPGIVLGNIGGQILADRIRTEKEYGPTGQRINHLPGMGTPEPPHGVMGQEV